MTSEHREVELKFRVDDGFRLPDLHSISGIATVDWLPSRSMTAVYHDTPTLALIRWRTTLRRREGGSDDGWHLKLPVGGADASVRDEIHVPLAAGPVGLVPAVLADIVAPLVRDHTLGPVATVHAHRTPAVLLDEQGRAVLELVDDAVRIDGPSGTTLSTYRELEVEVIDHTHPQALDLLNAVSVSLLAAGAVRSSVSKAAAALGPLAAQPPDVPEITTHSGLAVDALRAALSDHVRRLILADVAVRRDLADSVHQMRVAARRIRSLLRVFGPVLDPQWSGSLREELSWLADELGAIRDTEVMRARLDRRAFDLGDPDDRRASIIIDDRLNARMTAARSSALAALRSDRHEWLLEDLIGAVREPRVLDAAYAPMADVLLPYAQRAWRQFHKSIGALELDAPSDSWHQARIRGKRARYAVDVLSEFDGPRMRACAEALAEATDLLGDAHDAHVAQRTVRELASGAGVDGPTAFALGRLCALEHDHEVLDRVRFLDRWPSIARAARRARLT